MLYTKTIGQCRNIAYREEIQFRRSFVRELPKKLRVIRFSRSKKTIELRKKAKKRVNTIVGILVRELSRKLFGDALKRHEYSLSLFKKIIEQKRDSKNKTYSLHEPQVICIAKGKQHKKYEFGSKTGIAITKTTNIIMGVKNFVGNPYDGNTLECIHNQVKASTNKEPEKAFCDRGFRGRKQVGGTSIHIPCESGTEGSKQEKLIARNNFGRRSAIEPIIGHLKSDYRMARNFLKGSLGDAINLLMAAASFNFVKWMRPAALCLFFALSTFFCAQYDEMKHSLC